jgi:hypothetical protein
MPVDPVVLARMRELAIVVRSSNSTSNLISSKAAAIVTALRRKVYPLLRVLSIEHFHSSPLQHWQERQQSAGPLKDRQLKPLAQWSDSGPGDIVETLTTIELVNRTRIHPADYIYHLRDPAGSGRLAEARHATTGIKHWVLQEVLEHDSVHERGKAMKLFLAAANVSHEIHLSSGCPDLPSLGIRNAGRSRTFHLLSRFWMLSTQTSYAVSRKPSKSLMPKRQSCCCA